MRELDKTLARLFEGFDLILSERAHLAYLGCFDVVGKKGVGGFSSSASCFSLSHGSKANMSPIEGYFSFYSG